MPAKGQGRESRWRVLDPLLSKDEASSLRKIGKKRRGRAKMVKMCIYRLAKEWCVKSPNPKGDARTSKRGTKRSELLHVQVKRAVKKRTDKNNR